MPRDFVPSRPHSDRWQYEPEVIFQDDCQGALLWSESGTGGDTVFQLDSAAAFVGSKGLHLKTRTTGASNADTLYASRRTAFPQVAGLTFRLLTCFPALAGLFRIYLRTEYDDGNRNYDGELLIEPNSGDVQIRIEGTTFPAIPALTLHTEADVWFDCELTLDVLNHRYHSAIVNGLQADLSSYLVDTGPSSGDRHVLFQIRLIASNSPPAEAYFSHILLSGGTPF